MADAQAPVVEKGYATAAQDWWNAAAEEPTPELVWPASVHVFNRMRHQDAQCKSVLRAVTLPIIRTPWRLDPNGARDEVVRLVADDLALPIVGAGPAPQPRTRDRFSWRDHLELALLMLPLGHAFFEQVYRYDPQGRLRLRKLALRPSTTLSAVNVARDGGLASIEQFPEAGSLKPIKIEVQNLVAYVHGREGANWRGVSLLRAAYGPWLRKNPSLRVWVQAIDRNSMGVPVYTDSDSGNADTLAAGRKMATAYRSGSAAGAGLPSGAKLELLGVQGTLLDPEKHVRYEDEQIARSVLAHFLNLGTQTGSWALASVQADTFTQSLQSVAQQVADTANQHVVEDLVDRNFGETEPAPRVVFDEIGSQQAATAQALKALIDAGLIFPDRATEEALRQSYGLPPKAQPPTATQPPEEAA